MRQRRQHGCVPLYQLSTAEVSVAKPVSASRTVPEHVEERHAPTLHSSSGWQRLEHIDPVCLKGGGGGVDQLQGKESFYSSRDFKKERYTV
jgi:hypothetical protein